MKTFRIDVHFIVSHITKISKAFAIDFSSNKPNGHAVILCTNLPEDHSYFDLMGVERLMMKADDHCSEPYCKLVIPNKNIKYLSVYPL